MKLPKLLTAVALSCLLLVGCVNVANLIALGTQIAVNIISVIGAFQGHSTAADIVVAQSIGAEATRDWNLVVAAYNAYEANKTTSNLQNVVVVGGVLESDMATALADAHIVDPILSSRIEAIVSTLVTTVDSVAADLGATIPTTPAVAAMRAHLSKAIPASPKVQRSTIVNQWNTTVVSPTGVAAVDAALAKARL
jgi:hypothetical protein